MRKHVRKPISSLSVSIVFTAAITLCFCQIKGTEADDRTNEADSPHLDSLLTPLSSIESLFDNHTSDVFVTVKGSITTILRDDTDGSRHQRFILRLSNNQTLLIVHNIDIAPRVEDIAINDEVYVRGEYVWNDQGGLVHWTHRDPDSGTEKGWIVFEGKKYQ